MSPERQRKIFGAIIGGALIQNRSETKDAQVEEAG